MKIERVSNQIFKLDNASLPAGDYIIKPDEGRGRLSLYLKNGAYSLPVFTDKPFSQLANSAGVAYTTFAAASAALAAAVVSGDGVSGVVSDKGTVTQATSATTAVTMNNKNGVITTVAQTLAADTELTFTVNNSNVTTTSNVILSVIYPAASAGTPVAYVGTVSAGSFTVVLTNVNPTNALNAAVKIGFLVL